MDFIRFNNVGRYIKTGYSSNINVENKNVVSGNRSINESEIVGKSDESKLGFMCYIGMKDYDSVSGSDIFKEIKGVIADSSFGMNFSSSYSDIFKGGAGDSTEETVGSILKLLGITIKPFYLKRKVWDDTDNLSFSVNLSFFCREGVFIESGGRLLRNDNGGVLKEVIEPIYDLCKLVVPSRGSGKNLLKYIFMFPPDASYIESKFLTEFKKNISFYRSELLYIRIGNFIKFTKVYIDSVNITWDMNNLNIDGLPLSASVNVGFKTMYPITRDVLSSMRPSYSDDCKLVIGNDGDSKERNINLDEIVEDAIKFFTESYKNLTGSGAKQTSKTSTSINKK